MILRQQGDYKAHLGLYNSISRLTSSRAILRSAYKVM